MIIYNEFDLNIMDNLKEVFSWLGVKRPSDEDVWDIARRKKELLSFENIYIEIALNRLKDAVEQKWDGAEVSFSVNAAASYFCVNGNIINSKKDLEFAGAQTYPEDALYYLPRNNEYRPEDLCVKEVDGAFVVMTRRGGDDWIRQKEYACEDDAIADAESWYPAPQEGMRF